VSGGLSLVRLAPGSVAFVELASSGVASGWAVSSV